MVEEAKQAKELKSYLFFEIAPNRMAVEVLESRIPLVSEIRESIEKRLGKQNGSSIPLTFIRAFSPEAAKDKYMSLLQKGGLINNGVYVSGENDDDIGFVKKPLSYLFCDVAGSPKMVWFGPQSPTREDFENMFLLNNGAETDQSLRQPFFYSLVEAFSFDQARRVFNRQRNLGFDPEGSTIKGHVIPRGYENVAFVGGEEPVRSKGLMQMFDTYISREKEEQAKAKVSNGSSVVPLTFDRG